MMVTNMMIMNGEDIDDVDIISAGVGIGAGYDKVLDQNHFQPLASGHIMIMMTTTMMMVMMMVMMVVLMMVVSSTLAT